MPYIEDLKPDPPVDSLIPYIYAPGSSDPPNQPSYFNDIQYLKPPNPDTVNPYDIPGIPAK